MENFFDVINAIEIKEKSSLRTKAEDAKKKRSTTLICVLENPENIANISSVMRNIDALGVTKLYVVDGNNLLPNGLWKDNLRNDKKFNKISSSSVKYCYVKKFNNTKECLEYLKTKNYYSVITSPHKIEGKQNKELYKCQLNIPKLAIWFGCESNGISQEVIDSANICIQIEMAGIVESLNLSVSTGIILYTALRQRDEYNHQQNSKSIMSNIYHYPIEYRYWKKPNGESVLLE